jgi:feruloyl esterase
MSLPKTIHKGWHLGLIVLLAALALPKVHAATISCEDLADLKLEHTVITLAQGVTDGTIMLGGGKQIKDLPAFCRVAAVLHPAPDSAIHVEVWMPQTTWNGRIEGTGNGGLAGGINYGSLTGGLQRGYAVANTDMGLAVPAGKDASVFIDRPERWVDWGYRSTHEMTLLTKQLVKAYYGRTESHSYFVGCSTGGQQALSEAQRFPDDYDGVVAGAPAHNRTGVHESILWNFIETEKNPASYLPQPKLNLLYTAVINACDALDGVKDGIITDPRACRFDPASLQCKAGDTDTCLTAEQVATVKAVYAGPTDPVTGKQIYPGLPFGSESSWSVLGPTPKSTNVPPFSPVFQWVFGENWDWHTFNFHDGVDAVNTKLGTMLNAMNPDLDTFRSHGHKLLMYHGWADPLVAPQETINYYQAVLTRDAASHSTGAGKHQTAQPLNDSVRLYLIPGMSHCGGGPWPGTLNTLDAMVKWVEDGVAPDRFMATKAVGTPSTYDKRLLCPYPSAAHYLGEGTSQDPANYVCLDPKLK